VIEDYLRRDDEDDLVFEASFSKDERAVIHAAAHK